MIKLIKYIRRLIKIQQNKTVKVAAKNICCKCGKMNKRRYKSKKKIQSIFFRISHIASIINSKIQMSYRLNKSQKNQLRIQIRVKIINLKCIMLQNSQ